jgi:hypothetical protein
VHDIGRLLLVLINIHKLSPFQFRGQPAFPQERQVGVLRHIQPKTSYIIVGHVDVRLDRPAETPHQEPLRFSHEKNHPVYDIRLHKDQERAPVKDDVL